MKVKAIKDVYYNNRRWKKGAIFELKEIKGLKENKLTRKLEPHVFTVAEQFSSSTMEPVDGDAPIAQAKVTPKVRVPKSLAQAAKTDRTVVSDLEVI
jgi:hypothetical protein